MSEKIPSHTKDWTVRLLKHLADGEWHPYEEIMDEISPTIPPGTAFRCAEYYRSYYYKKAGREVSDRKYGHTTDTIKTGQRLLLGRSIQGLNRKGRLEVEYDETNPKRKRPIKVRKVR